MSAAPALLAPEPPVEIAPDACGYEVIRRLSKQTRRNIPDLLALARANDPFFAGAPAQRTAAEWFAKLWERFGYTTGIHLRRVHYQVVSQAEKVALPCELSWKNKETGKRETTTTYENTERCWDFLSSAGKAARYLGMVAADAFEDHRNPDPHLMAPGGTSPCEPNCRVREISGWSLPTIDTELDWYMSLRLPGLEVSGYDYDANQQPYLLEVWVEKSTMNDVLLPVCRMFGANLVTSAGFQSITASVNLLKRIHQTGKPARVFYVSDFDPAGDGMPVAVARQVEYWFPQFAPDADVKLTPLALTRDQVIAHRLPRIPVKDTDRRKAGFEERYGEGAVELDALEALHPGTLAKVLREAVQPYTDPSLQGRMSEERERAEAEASRAWEETVGHREEALSEIETEARQITAQYAARLEELNEELQAELWPLGERLDAIRREVEAAAAGFAADLPARPLPDTDPPDEGAWLFDSGRGYLEQLAVYQARRSRPAPPDAEEE